MLTIMFKTYKELEVYLHYAHLKTTSYAQHMALKEAYDAISDLNDTLAENLYRVTEELVIPDSLNIKTDTDTEAIKAYLLEILNMTRGNTVTYQKQLEIQDILIGYLNCINKLTYLLSLS